MEAAIFFPSYWVHVPLINSTINSLIGILNKPWNED